MPNIRIICYGHAEVSGNEMPLFVLGQKMRRCFSPKNENIVYIESRRLPHSNQLELNSAANIPFSIGVHFNPENRSVAQIQYNCNNIMVDDRWVISENRIRRISRCVPEPVNEILSITVDINRFQHIEQARMDISLNGGHYAAMILGLNGVIFVRFNGNYLINRYGLFIRRGIEDQMLKNRTNNDIQAELDHVVDEAVIQPLEIEQEQPDLVEETAGAGVSMVDFSSIRSDSSTECRPYPSLLREGTSRTIKYVVWNFLGSGSFGACFQIANFLITKKFACKFIDEKIMSKELIKNEIDILCSLKHRNVIEYIESFRCKGYMCIILSLCARSLRSFIELKKGDIALPDCRYFIAQILKGIDFIHSEDIIHRDLKPSNILLTDLMEVKISDFGLAIHKDDAQTNEACGTMEYLSPEALRYDGYSFASDIWAAGVILFELVNRNLPFRGSCSNELIESIQTSDYTIQENCDNEAENLIQIMLEKDASKRPTAGECLKENFIAEHEIIVPDIIDYDPNEILNVVSEPDAIN